MDRIAETIVKHRILIIILFVSLMPVCVLLQGFVDVNYNMVDYLPPSAPSTLAVRITEDEFSRALPNASVMVKDVSIIEALEYKSLLAGIEGVNDVMWLDDVADLKQPLETQDTGTVREYYRENAALFSLTIEDAKENVACAAIRELIGDENAISGAAADADFVQNASTSEVLNAMAILMPICIFILILSTDSWLEPLLFLIAIGVAVMLNMGTNIFFGQVSFMTNSVSPILQLAVSLDYAIFLLHSFTDNRKRYKNVEEAMKRAIKTSISTISASALTTLFGFIALAFMEFKLGANLGLILAKGILFSFISTVVFLPALTLCVCKTLDKARHRSMFPDTGNVNRGLSKTAIPTIIAVLLVIVPCFLGQFRTNFVYDAGSVGEGTYLSRDRERIEDLFGRSNVTALLVPAGDVVKERDLSSELEKTDRVIRTLSYAKTVGAEIPPRFLSGDITDMFYSDNYARIIIYTDTPNEGALAFHVVEQINAAAGKYYDEFCSAGRSSSLYDMKNVVAKDNLRVTVIAVVSILLVLLFTFRSLILPFILLITIETGIWVNLSVPYFANTSINFIGYLVLSTVQLGATVDYAILLTDRYMKNRRHMPKKEALDKSLGEAFKSVIISGITLSAAGFTLFLTSSNPAISDIGLLLGRGTLFSMFMVLCFLPPMLGIFDRAIAKLTLRAGFYYPDKL